MVQRKHADDEQHGFIATATGTRESRESINIILRDRVRSRFVEPWCSYASPPTVYGRRYSNYFFFIGIHYTRFRPFHKTKHGGYKQMSNVRHRNIITIKLRLFKPATECSRQRTYRLEIPTVYGRFGTAVFFVRIKLNLHICYVPCVLCQRPVAFR